MSVRLPIPAWIAMLAVLLALGFLGSRPIWDPDEGRYTNVALTMLDTGDWLNPRRNHETGHWTKPPATYWLIAASAGMFGRTPWAVRLPIALAFLACAFMAWRIARRLVPGSEATAALAFVTMLLPFGASQFVSTDFPLAALQTLAMWSYVEARFGEPSRANRWLTLMWAGFALAFLTKGPPAQLPLSAVLAHEWLVPSRRTTPFLRWTQALVFVLLALPWYAAVIQGHPGLLAYFLGAEVVDRYAGEAFDRHAEWYGWAKVYLPTLLLGTLPWMPALWRFARALPAGMRRWRRRQGRSEDAAGLLLALWILLPLLVFCLARSRMPLYLLPLFVPLAVAVARQRQEEGRSLPRWPWIALWAVVLLGLKVAAAHWPTHKDASAWASAIRERAPFAVHEVVFVEDMARYGLKLYLDADIEKISLAPVPDARFNPTFDQDLASELAEREPGVVYVTRQQGLDAVRVRIEALGYCVRPLGDPYHGRVMFAVVPADGVVTTAHRRADAADRRRGACSGCDTAPHPGSGPSRPSQPAKRIADQLPVPGPPELERAQELPLVMVPWDPARRPHPPDPVRPCARAGIAPAACRTPAGRRD